MDLSLFKQEKIDSIVEDHCLLMLRPKDYQEASYQNLIKKLKIDEHEIEALS